MPADQEIFSCSPSAAAQPVQPPSLEAAQIFSKNQTLLDQVQREVSSLYEYRDHYFMEHDISEAMDKIPRVEKKLEETLERVDSLIKGSTCSSPSSSTSTETAETALGGGAGAGEDIKFKSLILYYRGRIMNILSDHNPQAENLLSKSVKLDPTLVDAWNELGECYWKRGDLQNAQICFEGALRHKENKTSLRNLSIVYRQKGGNNVEEKVKNIEQGLTLARKAVSLDTVDGLSWSILGNAYLAHFFSVSQNPRTLKQSMSAYKQAEKDNIAKNTSELHYNKAIALKYEEDYTNALNSFNRAMALDPTWESPSFQKKSLFRSLTDIQTLIERKGKLNTKRFNQLIEQIDSKIQLGPYAGGKYNSSRGGSVSLNEINFAELKEGVNEEKVVLGKVICSIRCEDSVPFTFCLVDRTGRILAVNLYNLAPGKGVIIGDSVAIAEPYFTRIKTQYEDQVIAFDLIRVESPLVLVINGKKSSGELQAGIELSTFTKSN